MFTTHGVSTPMKIYKTERLMLNEIVPKSTNFCWDSLEGLRARRALGLPSKYDRPSQHIECGLAAWGCARERYVTSTIDSPSDRRLYQG